MIIDMITGQTYTDLSDFAANGNPSNVHWDTEVEDKKQAIEAKELYTAKLLELSDVATNNPSDPDKQPVVTTHTATTGLTRVLDVVYKGEVSSTETTKTYLKYKVIYGYYVTDIEQATSMAAQYKTYFLESETINI